MQIKIDDDLKRAIKKKADSYGVPSSSLVRIVLVKSFLQDEDEVFPMGNVFNAERDNQGKSIKIDDLISNL